MAEELFSETAAAAVGEVDAARDFSAFSLPESDGEDGIDDCKKRAFSDERDHRFVLCSARSEPGEGEPRRCVLFLEVRGDEGKCRANPLPPSPPSPPSPSALFARNTLWMKANAKRMSAVVSSKRTRSRSPCPLSPTKMHRPTHSGNTRRNSERRFAFPFAIICFETRLVTWWR